MPQAKRKTRTIARRKPQARGIIKKEPPTLAEAIEKVLITGDLTPLTPEQRVQYYNTVCKSLGLNPFTRPFAYILYKESDDDDRGTLQLYALRACTDQLRKIHSITVKGARRWSDDQMLYAEAQVQDRLGRTDSAIGVIPLKQYSRKRKEWYTLSGRMLANAQMHVETKAKRRATLSLCGLAFLDEAELDTMEVIGGVTPDGRIYRIEEETGTKEAAQAVAAEKIKQLEEKLETKKEEIAKPLEPKQDQRRIVWTKTMPDGDIAVSGYLADEAMQKFLADVAAIRFKSQKDGGVYWRFAPNYQESFAKLCGQLDIEAGK